jgi:S1-C subfamily serine protease
LVGLSALLIWLSAPWWTAALVWFALIELGFHLKGSLGKAIVGISVRFDRRTQYYLREVIGKLASLAVFGIGFLLVLSKEHLALHDFMAKTSVDRTGSPSSARRLASTLGLLVAVALAAYVGTRLGHMKQPLPTPLSASGQESKALSGITKQIPAVTTLYIYDRMNKLTAQGSGFLLDSEGLGVTNFHVLKGAYRAEARLGDERLYEILNVVDFDEEKDVLVFRIGRIIGGSIQLAHDLPHLALGSSRGLEVGDRIAIISSPEGLTNTVTDGLVSAIRGEGSERLLQITAPISPGSSGGPVFDLKGEVVGIATLQLRGGQNLNFAIPAEVIPKLSSSPQEIGLKDFYRLTRSIPSSEPAPPGSAGVAPEGNTTTTLTIEPLSGSFKGTVSNLNARLSADFKIVVRDDDGVLTGCMGVHRPLYGSGPLLGSVHGADVEFDVENASFSIHFRGRRSGDRILGTYRVVGATVPVQQGQFTLLRHGRTTFPKGSDASKNCPNDNDINP